MELKALSTQKIERKEDLTIRPAFPFYSRSRNLQAHLKDLQETLHMVLPDPLPFSDRDSLEKWLEETLPYVVWTQVEFPPDCVSIYFLIKPIQSLPTETFISEMTKRWLLPHEEATILSFKHIHFQFEHYPKQTFFLGEARVLVQNKREATLLAENLPLLKREMVSALKAGRYAKSLLETKALPLDHKMNLIRESFIKLLQKFPEELDESLFERLAFMQAYTLLEFRQERSYDHMGRIILTFFLSRNYVLREVNAFPEKRHMVLRFLPTKLSFPFGKKSVLGLAIAVNLFHKYEFFDEKHVLRAVQKFFPDMRIVTGSTYTSKILSDSVVNLYVELEKKDGSPIFLEERKALKKELQDELKKRIEHLVPSIFMVRNEEDTMRNILMLSREIKSKDDIPQIMISFDQHSQDDLIFTVVLLRVKHETSPSLQDLLKNANPQIRFIPDRIQNVSYINRTIPIEANVFRLQMTKLPSFLRMDFSVNLYLAREEAVKFLTTHLGEVRDYNGGMIVKQGEILTQFKRLFQEVSTRNQELLENFFYSLNPIETQATIALPFLSIFFETFLRLVETEFPRDESYKTEVQKDRDCSLISIRGHSSEFRTCVEEALFEFSKDRLLVTSSLQFEGSYYLSILLSDQDEAKHERFHSLVFETLEDWKKNQKKLQVLKLPYSNFVSLDPRIGGDQESSVITKLLFTGLMRIGKDGKPELSVAESYELSEDHLTYTFKLKKTFWSDGSPVTAQDFVYAWKKMVSPSFSTPFAYVFYPIKNAKLAKEGKVSVDEFGVKALDELTIEIHLENPAPYFLELTANILYCPVNHQLDQKHPNWSKEKSERFICNGPFTQVVPESGVAYSFKKNPKYVKKDEVFFDRILLVKSPEIPTIQMFKDKSIDIIGSGLAPNSVVDIKKYEDQVSFFPSTKVQWCCLNVQHFPFNNLKIRHALSKAIRRDIVMQAYSFKKVPAYTQLPEALTLCKGSDFLLKENEKEARLEFEQGLYELRLKKEDFPIIFISCNYLEVSTAQAIKNQWEKILGVKCVIESFLWKDLFKKLSGKNFEVGVFYWVSWLNDPIYTLQSFKNSKEKVNFSGWQNQSFAHLLDESDHTQDLEKRNRFLYEAEKVLIYEAPVIPVCYSVDWFLKRPNFNLKQSTFNGNIDFAHTFYEKN